MRRQYFSTSFSGLTGCVFTCAFAEPQIINVYRAASISILCIVPVLQDLAREIIDVFLSDPVVGGVIFDALIPREFMVLRGEMPNVEATSDSTLSPHYPTALLSTGICSGFMRMHDEY